MASKNKIFKVENEEVVCDVADLLKSVKNEVK